MRLICKQITDYKFYNNINYFKDNNEFYLGISKFKNALCYLNSSWNHIKIRITDNKKQYYL